jgi:membrane protein required for colicin V production
MNGFDMIITGVILFSIAIGVWRGFVKETLSLATWVAASVVAWLLADVAAELFEKDISQPALRLVVAFVLIFIVVYVLGAVATHFLNKILTRKPLLKLSNTVLGAVMGALRGVVIIVIGFLLAGLLPSIPKSGWWQASNIAPRFESAALFASDFLPKDIARHIQYD